MPVKTSFSDPAIAREFILEAREHLRQMEPGLLKLEEEPENREILDEIFRCLHTIKGASSFLGLTGITELSHNLESILDRLRRGRIRASSQIIDILLEGKDVLGKLVDDLAQGQAPACEGGKPHTGERAQQRQVASPETTKVPQAKPPDRLEMQAFLQAGSQHLEVMEDCLERMQQKQITQDTLEIFLRALRSLRNSAASIGLDELESIMSREEELIERFWSGQTELSPTAVELLLRTTDFVRKTIESLEGGGSGVDTGPLQRAFQLATQAELGPPLLGEILVAEGKASSQDIVQALQDQKRIGEILVDQYKINKEDLRSALHKQQQLRLEEQVKLENTIRVEESKLEHLLSLVGELMRNRDRLVAITQVMNDGQKAWRCQEDLEGAILCLGAISNQLQAATMDLRMAPIDSVFRRFSRVARDLARERGKEIDLQIVGGAIQVDRAVLEKIGEPLLHLVRNSIEHGIESPQERRKLKKLETGKVILRASQGGHDLVIEVEDDGRGVDAEAIRKKAVEEGLLTDAEAEKLDEVQALDLIFAPGISTAAEVTSECGRGVGLDIVKRTVRGLHGDIGITTNRGEGVKFTLRLPLSLAAG